MYPAIYRTLRLLWPGGLSTRRHLQELERTQWLSAENFQALQLAKIQALVAHAYENVPFYRKRYQEAGIHPRDIKCLADFQALPFLTRRDVEAHREDLIARNFPRHTLDANETGGSTGEPMRFFVSRSFWWWNAANWFRARRWYGVHEGEKAAWFWGAKEDMPAWSLRRRIRAWLMQERYLNAFDMNATKMKEFAEMLVQWSPAMLKGYVSTLILFARYVQEHGITIRPRYIETTSEKLTDSQRALLEDVFACQVADHYSSREMGTMAYQCPEGGVHICADVRYLEVVADEKVVGPGQMGEVVVTSLNQFAMPFIRYKNGDMGILHAGQCPCGRSLPLLKEIVGRTNDYLVSADGHFVHSEFFAYIFRVKPEVVRYQVYQPDKEHLEVRVVCRQDVDTAWLERVKSEIQSRFGKTMHILLEIVDDIALTPAGKHRYIVSEVQPDF